MPHCAKPEVPYTCRFPVLFENRWQYLWGFVKTKLYTACRQEVRISAVDINIVRFCMRIVIVMRSVIRI
jgi:hypothetical protein